MNKNIFIAGLIASGLFAGCKPHIDQVTPVKGNADFSSYVAIGNSLTAGYADGSLYRTGQLNSYPSMLATQFKQVGGGAFLQPLLPGNSGWPIAPAAGYDPKLVLAGVTGCNGVTSLGPIPYPGTADTAGSNTNISAQGPFNNVGIPGIRCIDYLFPGYGIFNPYATRFFSNPSTEKPLDEALKIKATFFTIDLGNNDVLGYATSGGSGTVGGTGTSDISPVATFQAVYNAVVAAMVANGAKGVLVNIPDVTTIPFFTTIPANGLVLRQGQADTLSEAYAPVGIKFNAGANYFIMADPSSPFGFRHMKAGEYVLITTPQDSLTCAGWGVLKPIPGQYILSADEVANVKSATASFNQIIKQAATANGLAYVDLYSYLGTVGSGITFNGASYNASFVTGGAFSLDGVHLTPRGYALIANQIIQSINITYGSTLPAVDINSYSGIIFP